MTRKDYVLIAQALNDAQRNFHFTEDQEGRESQHAWDCKCLADALAADNTRFDRERFLRACGVQS